MISRTFLSSNSMTLSINSRSSCSRTPSCSIVETISSSSSSVAVTFSMSIFFSQCPSKDSTTKEIGRKIVTITDNGFATKSTKDSAFAFATILGAISPNTKIRIVITAVAKATPLVPKISVNNAVANEVAKMFTTLFPIKIVVITAVKFLEIV